MAAWHRDPANREHLETEALADFARITTKRADGALGDLVVALGKLALWTGTTAALRIVDEDRNGWTLLRSAGLMRAWRASLLVSRARALGRPLLSATELAVTSLHLTAIGSKEQQRWCCSFFADSIDSVRSWDLSPLPSFAHSSSRLVSEGELGGDAREPYGAWERALKRRDAAGLTKALLGMCDYHCARVEDPNDSGYPEFEEYPYPLFAPEILVALRASRSLVEIQLPTHPLLRNPLAHPPGDHLEIDTDDHWHNTLLNWFGCGPPAG